MHASRYLEKKERNASIRNIEHHLGNRKMKNTSKKFLAFKIFMNALIISTLLIKFPPLAQAQSVDRYDPDSLFDIANALYDSGLPDSAYAVARQASRQCLVIGDTLKACKMLHNQARLSEGHPEEGLQAIEQAIQYYADYCHDTSTTYFLLRSEQVRRLIEREDFTTALQLEGGLHRIADRLMDQYPEMACGAIADAYTNIGYAKKQQGLVQAAISDFLTAIHLNDRYPNCIDAPHLADHHDQLGQLYRQQGNLPMALAHNQKASAILDTIAHKTIAIQESQWQYLGDYALILEDAGKLSAAKRILQRVIAEKTRLFPGNQLKLVRQAANLGHLWIKMDSLAQAKAQLNACQKIYAENHGGPFLSVAKLYINMAIIEKRQLQYAKQRENAQSALHLLQDHDVVTGSYCAMAWTELGLAHLAMQEYGLAIRALREAMNATFPKKTMRADAGHVNFGSIWAPKEYLAAMAAMGQTMEQQFHATKALADLHQAVFWNLRAARFMAYIDASRLGNGTSHYRWEQLWKGNIDVLEAGIRCATQLHSATNDPQYAQLALGIADMSKARQVAKHQVGRDDKIAALLPQEAHAYEHHIRHELELHRILQNMATTPAQQRQATANIFASEAKLRRYQEALRRDHPAYYRLRFENIGNVHMTAAAIARRLQADEAILEYFVGKDSIYAFLKTYDTLQIAIIPHKAQVEQCVIAFTSAISSRQTPAHIALLSKNLSQQLLPFAPLQRPLHRLRIIPDGFLHQLPFAALVPPDAQYHPGYDQGKFHWLVNMVSIAYDFSMNAAYASDQAAFGREPVAFIHHFCPRLAFFPPDSQPSGLDYVPACTDELQAFADLRSIIEHMDDQATVEALYSAMQAWNIVQLKTHGYYEEVEGLPHGYLILSDHHHRPVKLHASDLFGMRTMRNRMLVLNACETARGGYQPGEGPISLVLGFRLIGCPTILSNQWQASANANANILHTYYAGLANGLRADESLRLAQIEAIQNGLGDPWLWAGLKLYGVADNLNWE